MSPVQSVASAALPAIPYPVPAPVPAAPAAPVAVNPAVLTADAVTLGSSGVAATQQFQHSAIQLAEATPQQLAQLAADGNSQAKAILAKQAAVQKLLDPVDITV